MKITNRMLYDQLNKDIAQNTEKLFYLNNQISSGKRITKPSDDPLGLSSVLVNRTELNMFSQYERSINFATGWLNRMDSILQDTDDILGRVTELAVGQSSATATAATRLGTAEEIKQLRQLIMSNSNAKYGSKYIFSGTQTRTQPYLFVDAESELDYVNTLADAPAAPAEGDAIYVNSENRMYVYDGSEWKSLYQGNDSSFSQQIGRSTSVQTNIPGSSIFENTQGNINLTLLRLEKAMRSNDVDGIRAEITNIENASIVINNNLALVGANINKLEHTKTVLDQSRVDTKESISNIEDLDYAEAITSLQNQQTIYEATLKSSSMITALSLVDYI